MDYHPFKAAVNRYLSRSVGETKRPVFFDIGATCPALNDITRNYPTIRGEFERVWNLNPSMPTYHEVDPGERAISATVDPDKKWTVFMLYVFGYKPERNRSLCPETCRILDRVPNMIQAFFSILEPGKSVPLHEGPYLGYLRYHLGLSVPKENPPKLIVNSKEYVWKPGEAVMFDDSWPHQVINHSNEIRAVLIVDVLRQLPLLPTVVNKLVTRCVFRPFYGKAVARRADAVLRNDETKPTGGADKPSARELNPPNTFLN